MYVCGERERRKRQRQKLNKELIEKLNLEKYIYKSSPQEKDVMSKHSLLTTLSIILK